MSANTETALMAIAKELHEINRKLDRLCQASIFSLNSPIVNVAKISEEKSEKIRDKNRCSYRE